MQSRTGFLKVAESVAFVALETSTHIDLFSVVVEQTEFVTVGTVGQSFVELLYGYSQAGLLAECLDGFIGFFSVVAQGTVDDLISLEYCDLGEGHYMIEIVYFLIDEVPDEDEVIDFGGGSMRVDVVEQ